jgi:hypothetical protein
MMMKWMLAAMTCAAIVAMAPVAAAVEAKRTVIVCGGARDPVTIRARAELERASIDVSSSGAEGDVSRTEIETLARTTGASAALVIRPEGVEVWLVDDSTQRASLIERVEDNELGVLRAVEITRASFGASGAARASAAPPSSVPASAAPVTPNEQRAVDAGDEVPRWTISARTGPAILLSQNGAYPNSFVVPIEVGLQRALGRRVSLGVYGAGAPGHTVLNGRDESVAQWRVGSALQLRLGSKPGAGMWTSLAVGYTVLEFESARRGADAALSAGYDFRLSDHTTVGPFVSARGGVSEGQVHETQVSCLSVFGCPTISTEGPATLFASGLVGARVAFAGL